MVVNEFPDDAGALNDLAYLWAARRAHLDVAQEMAARAVADEPDNGAYRDTLGWIYYQMADWQRSVDQLEHAIAVTDPSDSIVWEHFGDALWKVDRRTDAREAWQNALRHSSPDGDAFRRLTEKSQRGHATQIAGE